MTREEQIWRRIVEAQNQLDEQDCSLFMSHLVQLFGNTVKVTDENRIMVLKQLGKWKE